jgi:hypothetical protein
MVLPEFYTFALHVCVMPPSAADSFGRCRYSKRTLGECRIFSAAPGGQLSWFARTLDAAIAKQLGLTRRSQTQMPSSQPSVKLGGSRA